MPQIDRDAELKAALSSTEVVTAIFELQSEPVVIHEDPAHDDETRHGVR